MIQTPQVTLAQAKAIAKGLEGIGWPGTDRILVLSPKVTTMTTTGGILLPESIDEKDLPRKGVVIQNNSATNLVAVGTIITYGMYAGKEIIFDTDRIFPQFPDLKDYKFTILSVSEIIYQETNK